MITQAELQAYRELKEHAEAATSALQEDRDELLAREGEEVEDGPLTMRVNLRNVRAFSYDALVEMLGATVADNLRGMLPEKQSRVLSVGLS